ncbi:unnamed protein product [Tilletia laevis]|uniref:Uncharacterized protein n=1 Tax=Tilletia laevis TaxID=157183 RepID=A0A9N8LT09_9BASI|nr:hypothetical protein CF336_g9198 [Tilletia laevis]CAD6940042.1 unnamed protein product [Tilletia laevis]
MDLSDFAIEPLREDCLDAAAEIFAVSFADGFRAVFPRGPTKDMVRFLRGELARAMARADTEEPSAMYPHAKDCRGGMRGKIRAFVARHRPTGQLAGFYVNELYENGRAARHGPVPPSERFPEGGDELLFDTFHQTSAASMRKFFGDESFAYYEFAAHTTKPSPWPKSYGPGTDSSFWRTTTSTLLRTAYEPHPSLPESFWTSFSTFMLNDAHVPNHSDPSAVSQRLLLDPDWKGERLRPTPAQVTSPAVLKVMHKKERVGGLDADGRWSSGSESIYAAVWKQGNDKANRKIFLPAITSAVQQLAAAPQSYSP